MIRVRGSYESIMTPRIRGVKRKIVGQLPRAAPDPQVRLPRCLAQGRPGGRHLLLQLQTLLPVSFFGGVGNQAGGGHLVAGLHVD